MFNMCELSSAFVQIKLKPIAYFLVFLTLRVHVLTYSHFMDTPVWFLAELFVFINLLFSFSQVKKSDDVIDHGRWNHRDRGALLCICEYPAG